MSYDITQAVKITNASPNVDWYYGGDIGYWDSLAAAKTGVPEIVRMIGKTVAIKGTDTGNVLKEYWWRDGKTDNDLVEKSGGGSVTSVKVGTTTYSPVNGIIELPKYPMQGTAGEIAISNGDDLNEYVTVGTYGTSGGNSGSTVAESLLNKPTFSGGFRIYVESCGGDGSYIRQTIITKAGLTFARTSVSLSATPKTWTDWKQIATTSDIPTTLDSVSDGTTRKLSNYLPLSGGTMTGTLKVNNIVASDNSGMLAYKPSDWSYVSNTQWGVGAANCQGVIRSNATNLIHSKNGTAYSIVDTSNSAIGGGVGTHISKQGTKTGNYILITINSYTTWMLSFRVRMYANYVCDEYIISGYNYGSNHWHSPTVILANSNGTSRDVIFGYTSESHLWVAIPNNNYYGCDIIDVVNGYTQVSLQGLFTLTETSTLSGTSQTTVTVSPMLTSVPKASSSVYGGAKIYASGDILYIQTT